MMDADDRDRAAEVLERLLDLLRASLSKRIQLEFSADPLLPGITGEFFRQFALTIAVAVVFSVINALTLSPALSALLLVATAAFAPIFGLMLLTLVLWPVAEMALSDSPNRTSTAAPVPTGPRRTLPASTWRWSRVMTAWVSFSRRRLKRAGSR